MSVHLHTAHIILNYTLNIIPFVCRFSHIVEPYLQIVQSYYSSNVGRFRQHQLLSNTLVKKKTNVSTRNRKKMVNSLQPHIDFSSYKRLHVDRTFCARKKTVYAMQFNMDWVC